MATCRMQLGILTIRLESDKLPGTDHFQII